MNPACATADDRPVADRLRSATDVLEALAVNRSLVNALPEAERRRLWRAVSLARGPASRARRRLAKVVERQARASRVRRDRCLQEETGIREVRRRASVTTRGLSRPRNQEPRVDHVTRGTTLEPITCYVCKERYSTIHHFYDQLCPSCAELNFAKRTELADLRGRVALVTGARVKIGYQAALKLLRSGARIVATTRFPRDAAKRYGGEPDFAEWKTRLEIVGLDLRHIPSVHALCDRLTSRLDRLDFVVNNACQTVRRPPAYYAHMLQGEREADDVAPDIRALTEGPDHLVELMSPTACGPTELIGLARAAALSQVPLVPDDLTARSDLFPPGAFDGDWQQIDLREHNSWRLRLADVSTVELLEVHLVNAIAPFVINARLKALMLRTSNRDKHIVNVSAVEGQFYRSFKTTRHPHTNMAKAALNMLTRTSAADYQADGIHMNSVDTGWVTDEDPESIAARKTAEQGFHPPLDAVDGAARVVDPIISGIRTGTHVWGRFLKDYGPTDW